METLSPRQTRFVGGSTDVTSTPTLFVIVGPFVAVTRKMKLPRPVKFVAGTKRAQRLLIRLTVPLTALETA